jgi:hypothetical protein
MSDDVNLNGLHGGSAGIGNRTGGNCNQLGSERLVTCVVSMMKVEWPTSK